MWDCPKISAFQRNELLSKLNDLLLYIVLVDLWKPGGLATSTTYYAWYIIVGEVILSISAQIPVGLAVLFFENNSEAGGSLTYLKCCLDSGVGIPSGCRSKGRILRNLNFKIRGYEIQIRIAVQGSGKKNLKF